MTRRRNKLGSSDSSDDAQSEGGSSSGKTSSSVVESLQRLGQPLPKLVAFDLDYTVWPLWVDTHVDTPIKRKGDSLNKVVDRNGTTMSLFPHVPSILFFLQSQEVIIAAASRTSAPTAARQALQGLVLMDDSLPPTLHSSTRQSQVIQSRTPVKAMSLFTQQEIYPGSKLTHFKSLHAKTNVPYEEMLFFDDEHRNAEVGKLGVHFQLVGHQGTDLATFERGIREWRAKKKAREGSLDAGSDLI
ncbi:hypothetical protein CBS101457_004600 [Exobasidium rhododendri]|nr:hypothetical protein CBS101457_004600 [Exobasidium rhododendri]